MCYNILRVSEGVNPRLSTGTYEWNYKAARGKQKEMTIGSMVKAKQNRIIREEDLLLSDEQLPLEGSLKEWQWEVPDKNCLKDSLNRHLVAAPFMELRSSYKMTPLFTLKENDLINKNTGEVVYRSLKKLYLAYEDVTEYSFAIGLFGSWSYWQALLKTSWLQSLIGDWREELLVRLKSKALMNMKKISEKANDSRQSYDAIKYLCNNTFTHDNLLDFVAKKTPKVGRPKKKEPPHVEERNKEEVAEDALRLLGIRQELDEGTPE